MPPIAVIDFETTGHSPDMGDRATEVAIVLVEGDQIVDRFQSLMNAGVRISPFAGGVPWSVIFRQGAPCAAVARAAGPAAVRRYLEAV